ncbi:MAG: hypothetical protein K1W39_04875, partial [Lachnospiraceae bacterium]
HTIRHAIGMIFKGVNALKRAAFISTPLLESPVYKDLKGAFSPRFFKLLQKCYILPVFLFF